MANWSVDSDLVLREPAVLGCFPRERAELIKGSDGATNAAGTGFSSAAIGSGFLTAGVLADQYLEITEGEYQGFYRVATAAAGLLTLDRPIAASLTSLSFRVRTFAAEHSEAHQHYLDQVLRKLGSLKAGDANDAVFNENKISVRSLRNLRDLCVARVLAIVFRAAAAGAVDSPWWKSADFWDRKEKELKTCIDSIEMDTDADGAVDSEESLGWGSVEARIT